MKKIIYLLSMLLLYSACESMEDTYSEFNTPKDRYVGKCTDLVVELGWNRLFMTWKNADDPSVEKIVLTWQSSQGVMDSVVLGPNEESYILNDALENLTYRVSVYAIDIDGRRSLPVASEYVTPLTENSSAVTSLQQLERKVFYISRNGHSTVKIALQPDSTSTKKVISAWVSYTTTGGEVVDTISAEEFGVGNKYLLDVDPAKPVYVQSVVLSSLSTDTIFLPPYELDIHRKSFTGTFYANLVTQFNTSEITDDMLNNLRVLHINYDIESLEDILYFPNLDTLVLGKKRMRGSTETVSGVTSSGASVNNKSKLVDQTGSNAVLKELMEIDPSFFVEHYSLQYGYTILKGLPSSNYNNITTWEAPQFPRLPRTFKPIRLVLNENGSINLAYYDKDDISKYDYTYPLTNLERVLENWVSIQSEGTVNKTHIVYEFLDPITINGFRYEQTRDKNNEQYIPSTVEIYVSYDGNTWEPAFYQAAQRVGEILGEVTMLNLPEPITIRKYKIVANDIVTSRNNAVALGSFIPLL